MSCYVWMLCHVMSYVPCGGIPCYPEGVSAVAASAVSLSAPSHCASFGPSLSILGIWAHLKENGDTGERSPETAGMLWGYHFLSAMGIEIWSVHLQPMSHHNYSLENIITRNHFRLGYRDFYWFSTSFNFQPIPLLVVILVKSLHHAFCGPIYPQTVWYLDIFWFPRSPPSGDLVDTSPPHGPAVPPSPSCWRPFRGARASPRCRAATGRRCTSWKGPRLNSS